jgi:hypothetical protein
MEPEPVVVFIETTEDEPTVSLSDLKDISRDLRKRRREWQAEKRRVAKQMQRIRVDMDRLYPDPDLVEALALLLDQDLVWHGDFDDLREPLAELLLKLHACGVFTDDVTRLAKLLLCIPAE